MLMLAALLVLVGAAWLVSRSTMPSPSAPAVQAARSAAPSAVFVGSASCAACHAPQHAAWTTSQHALAMQPASACTVLGDFANASFTNDGVNSTFSTRDGHYYVRTEGPDGKLADFEITYTFGVEPLQQYLIPFPDGRLQALGIAWDTRTKEQGGQRWFDLYPNDKIDYRDVLHWSHPAQNWNHQCAECHSTNLRKNYHADTRRFDTTWS